VDDQLTFDTDPCTRYCIDLWDIVEALQLDIVGPEQILPADNNIGPLEKVLGIHEFLDDLQDDNLDMELFENKRAEARYFDPKKQISENDSIKWFSELNNTLHPMD